MNTVVKLNIPSVENTAHPCAIVNMYFHRNTKTQKPINYLIGEHKNTQNNCCNTNVVTTHNFQRIKILSQIHFCQQFFYQYSCLLVENKRSKKLKMFFFVWNVVRETLLQLREISFACFIKRILTRLFYFSMDLS